MNLKNTSRLKSIFNLIFGMGISQFILLLLFPVLTRFYSTSDIGYLGTYLTSISICVIFFTGRYEMAIVISKDYHLIPSIENLCRLRSFIILIILLSLLTLIYIFYPCSKKFIFSYNIYLILFGSWVLSHYNLDLQRCLQVAQYKNISIARIIYSLMFAFGSTIFLIFLSPNVIFLLISDLIARYFAGFKLRRSIKIHEEKYINIKKAYRRFSRFSNFEQVTAFLSILSIQSPIVIIPFIFNAHTAGLYFIVFRCVMSPVALITNAVYDVFKVEASKLYKKSHNCRPLVIYTIKRLFLIGIIPTLILLFFSKPAFIFLLGQDYATAGQYSQYLAPSVLLRFVAVPLGFILQLREMVGLNSIFYAFFLLATCFSMLIGWKTNSPELMVISISVSSSLLYFIQILLGFIFSKNDNYLSRL